MERPCGTECPTPDDSHLSPEPDWIGDVPILHGERDGWVPGKPDAACLCGHPVYWTCPHAFDGGIMSMVIGDDWGGRLTHNDE